MEKSNIYVIDRLFFKKLVIVLSAFLVISGCEIQDDFEYVPSNVTGKIDMTAWEYVQATDSLSIFREAVTIAQLENYYSGSDLKTFIIPRNSAFRDYLGANNYLSLSDVLVPILRNMLLYHIVKIKVIFSDPELSERDNPIAYDTENGQIMYLSHDNVYRGLINQGTNKSWTLISSNLEPTNGVIHIVSSVAYYSAVTGSTVIPDPSLDSDTIYATQDAYVRAGTYVDDNFGAADDLTLRSDNGTGINDRKVFLMFDLSEITTSGTLREAFLNVGAYFAAGKGESINLHNVQDITWSESSITWNNMPSPDTEVFSSIPSTTIPYLDFGLFTWDCTDYLSSKLASPGIVSILIDAALGTNDGILFVSKENSTYSYPAMLVAVFTDGSSNLAMGTNTGLTVANGGTVVLDTDQLSMDGAEPSDIVYTVEGLPNNGWLIQGASILGVGDKFTQLDIDVNNIVYIHDGSAASSDSFSLSVKDRDGGSIDPFNFEIAVQ